MSLSRRELKASLREESKVLKEKKEYFYVIHQLDEQAVELFKRIKQLEKDIEKDTIQMVTKNVNIQNSMTLNIGRKKTEINANKNMFSMMNKQSQLLVNKMPDNFPEKNDLITLSLSERYKYLKSAIKNLDAQISEKDSSVIALNSLFGNIKRSMGSRKGGRKSKRRSRKNKRKTRRKGGVLKPSASTAVADMTYKREKNKNNDSKTVKNSTVKDSKKKGESGFSIKLTKKMASKFKK